MQTIATIQTRSLTAELKIHEMQETYTILSEHNIKVSKRCFFTQKHTTHTNLKSTFYLAPTIIYSKIIPYFKI